MMFPTSPILDTVLQDFTSAINAYGPSLQTIGAGLLTITVFLQGSWLCWQALMQRDFLRMVDTIGLGFLKLGFLKYVFNHIGVMGTGFIAGFTRIAGVIAGSGTLTPSAVVQLGYQTVSNLWTAHTALGWFVHPEDAIVVSILSIVVVLIWFGAGCIVLAIGVDAAWVVVMSYLALCWAGLEMTFATLPNCLGSIIRAGTKLVAVTMIVAIGAVLANGWTGGFSTSAIYAAPIQSTLIALFEATCLYLFLWKLPHRAQELLHVYGGGGDSSNIGRALFGISVAAATETVKVAGHVAAGTFGQYAQRKLS